MQEKSREKVQFLIQDNIRAIKSTYPKIALSRNSQLLQSAQEKNELDIDKLLLKLQEYHAELFLFIKKIKTRVNDIAERTHICAVYLLINKIFDDWSALFLLAKNGKSLAANNLLRTVSEGVELIHLFIIEASQGGRSNLDSWLSGEIIPNRTCRKKVAEHHEKYSFVSKIDFRALSSHIYQMESQVPHNSYESILESVSPFTEDYDHEGFTGYQRTVFLLHYASGSMAGVNIVLKAIFGILINEASEFQQLDQILRKYNPDVDDIELQSE